MIIAKYNIAQGSGSNASQGATAVSGGAGGSASVDLTPITDKIATLESKVSNLELQLNKANIVLAGLDGRFLSKFGDRSEYSYALGALYTDFIQSELYWNGVGFRISGSPTAAVEDKYNLIIKDVGWARVAFNSIQQSEVTMVDSNTDGTTAQLNANVSIGATNAAGYILVDCGATLTNERCFSDVAKTVTYSVTRRIGNQIDVTGYQEAETDSAGNFILYFGKGDAISFSIRFEYTFAFRQYGNMTSGTYRLYIQGTDAGNSQTDIFGTTAKTTIVNASGVTVMQGDDGKRITSSGVQTTTDGGTTWT